MRKKFDNSNSTTIRPERVGDILGVPGRFHNVIVWPQVGGELANQKWYSDKRQWMEGRDRVTMQVEIQHDDNCKNGRPSFAVTASGWRNGRQDFGGCCHELIAEKFPELAPLIQWHLCATDGPMHYIANTVYHAGDRDHNGKRKGEPWAWDEAVQFGDNPIKHELDRKFAAFLKDHAARGFDFEVIGVDDKDRKTFGTHYTFGGFGTEWYQCPFKSEDAALDFLTALQRCAPTFMRIPTQWSDGKERDLDAARRCAVWPDATDAELCADPEVLKAALAKRLPDLIARMRADVEGVGFIWSTKPE